MSLNVIVISSLYDICSASGILNMTTVRNYLEIFIQEREYLLRQKIITLKAKSSSGASSPVSHHKGHLRFVMCTGLRRHFERFADFTCWLVD